ncbi:MAG TPA: hypothetical protein VF832_01130, partial [Longimicrobiales bacterium]
MRPASADEGEVRNPLSRRDFIRVGTAGLGAIAAAAGSIAEPASAESAPAPGRAPAGPIRVAQTGGSLHHAERPALTWSGGAGRGGPAITLRPERQAQEVLGFGAAFTDAACYTFNRLTPEARAALFHELYHPSEMGFNVGRTCVGSSDYSTVPYSYDESPEPDPELARFSIDFDRQWILPMLRQAR